MTEATLTLKQTALRYASLGLAVFPLQSGAKTPLTSHGCYDATTDQDQINDWWEQNPDANIGVATGQRSGGLVVIDIDKDEDRGIDGYHEFENWQKEHGRFPDSWLCITGRGGYHLYLHSGKGVGNRVGVLEGVDIRSDGGYVVAPPSIHSNGHRYEWEVAPEDIRLADAGPLIGALVNGKDAKNDEHFHTPETIPEGQRNATLFKQACSMRVRGDPEAAILAAVTATNESICVPPLSDSEVKRIVESSLRYEQKPKPLTTVENGVIRPLDRHAPIFAVTAAELAAMDIAPIEWLVEGLLPVGLSMIGAPAKYFKSYMALGLCIEICTGGTFLGHKCNQHSCLYFDLESTRRRPKERLAQILDGRPAPDNLFIITGDDDVGRIGDGFESLLEDQLLQHPDIRLVIIDVFQKIRQAAKRNQSGYDRDYDDLKVLKDIADSHDIGVMLIHHTRKMKDTDDVFNELSGSVGIMGALDAAWVITKDARDDTESTLHVTGRDMESVNLQVKFDHKRFQWECLGTAEEIAAAKELEDYRSSPITKTILTLVDLNGGHWEGTVQQIRDASWHTDHRIEDDLRLIGKKIREYEPFFWAVNDIDLKDMKNTGKPLQETMFFQSTKITFYM